MVVSLSLPVVFCGGPMLPCVRYSCSLGGSGFCVAFGPRFVEGCFGLDLFFFFFFF